MSRPPHVPPGEEARVNAPAFWAQRYADGLTPWNLGQVTPPLVRLLSTVDAAVHPRALVPGCGHGHEALHLARRGHEVVAVDLVPEPVERLRALGEARLTVLQADLFRLPPDAAGPFDLVVEHCCFCAIEPARRGEYVAVTERVLRPGGLLAALFFSHGRPGGPPWTTDTDEIRRLFGERFEMLSLETPADSVEARRGQETLVLMKLVRQAAPLGRARSAFRGASLVGIEGRGTLPATTRRTSRATSMPPARLVQDSRKTRSSF